MKIEQKKSFEPITIVLETEAEARWLWNSLDNSPKITICHQKFIDYLSNWFSNEAKL